MKCHLFVLYCLPLFVSAQLKFSHADSLKGQYGKSREWWDVLHYDIHAKFDPTAKTVTGKNVITYKVLKTNNEMQLDLMAPMVLDSVVDNSGKRTMRQDGEAYFIQTVSAPIGSLRSLTVYFHGQPREAKNPPWDGGIIWTKDEKGRPWVSLACQGMAARVWLPNKDHQQDEPDSATMHFSVPDGMMAVSNGQLKSLSSENGYNTFVWKVVNPINNYNIIPYLGNYRMFSDTLLGKKGVLKLEYWVLDYNVMKARNQFQQAKTMLHFFEEWFGPYPFYEDGYKLVEAPYLGMEHQSGIAYGNKFSNGYLGRDLSGSGWGLKWDFLIIHESGHEWFGNNITASDVADNWIHESFTTYSENLYTEYLYGKKAGSEYVIGTRKAIRNDKPMIGPYGVNRDGSGDVYYKGANMLHTLRQMVNNDSLWKELLRSLNKTYWHKTVTSAEIETYVANFLKLDLSGFFDQYLRSTQLPELQIRYKKGNLQYRWSNTVKKFHMPVNVFSGSEQLVLMPTEKWQSIKTTMNNWQLVPDYYVEFKVLN